MRIRDALLTLATLTFGVIGTAESDELTALHRFDFADGHEPTGVLAQGRDGQIYGTTPVGGSYGYGVIFRISPRGAFTKIHDFRFEIDGMEPHGLTLGADGNLYGATNHGGGKLAGGKTYLGTLFRTNPRGGVTVLHRFKSDQSEGRWALAPPVQGRDGNFYGSTGWGGDDDMGVLYRLTPQGGFQRIHSFSGWDGAHPNAPLSVGSDGNLYGTTVSGGAHGKGTVFRLTGKGVLTTLHDFDGVHGGSPSGVLAQDEHGNWYGTAAQGGMYGDGAVFKLDAKGVPRAAYTVLHDFDGAWDGVYGFSGPSGLALGSDGNFYGSLTLGGTNDGGCGALFRVTPAGRFAVAAAFGEATGCWPMSSPLVHTNGMLYGSTFKDSNDEDPIGGEGTIYRFDVDAPGFVAAVPAAAKVGATVGLLGSLTGTSSVKFNGVATRFSSSGGTFRSAVVPPGAATGSLQVIAARGALTTLKPFRQLPTLNGFSPGLGPVGTVVTLTGSGLTQTTAVRFGSKSASFIINNDGKLTAIVPPTARTGAIVVTTKGGQASSAPAPFVVTPF